MHLKLPGSTSSSVLVNVKMLQKKKGPIHLLQHHSLLVSVDLCSKAFVLGRSKNPPPSRTRQAHHRKPADLVADWRIAFEL